MKTIHILYEYDGECHNVIGAYTSEDLAEAMRDYLNAKDKVRYPGGGGAHRYVDELELDAEIPV